MATHPVINLVTLMNSVSNRKVTKVAQYTQALYADVFKFEEQIKSDIETLTAKRIELQNRRDAEKQQAENRVRADAEALMATVGRCYLQQTH